MGGVCCSTGIGILRQNPTEPGVSEFTSAGCVIESTSKRHKWLQEPRRSTSLTSSRIRPSRRQLCGEKARATQGRPASVHTRRDIFFKIGFKTARWHHYEFVRSSGPRSCAACRLVCARACAFLCSRVRVCHACACACKPAQDAQAPRYTLSPQRDSYGL